MKGSYLASKLSKEPNEIVVGGQIAMRQGCVMFWWGVVMRLEGGKRFFDVVAATKVRAIQGNDPRLHCEAISHALVLQKPEHQPYICWYSDSEILIKSGKRLEEKVLPHYFRHKRLSSFIRQLNMYKFSKITKLTKEKHQMYFRNEHFVKGDIRGLLKIKRNVKRNKLNTADSDLSEQPSIHNGIEQDSCGSLKGQGGHPRSHKQGQCSSASLMTGQHNSMPHSTPTQSHLLEGYKSYVMSSVKEIAYVLDKVSQLYPKAVQELKSARSICNQLLEVNEPTPSLPSNQIYSSYEHPAPSAVNLTSTKILPRLDSVLFPSMPSFYQFNS